MASNTSGGGKTLCKCILKTFPFPRCLKPLFQSEAKCEAIDWSQVLRHSASVLKLIVFGTWKLSVKTSRNYRGFQNLYFRPFLKFRKHFSLFFVSFIAHNFCYFKPVKSPEWSTSIFSCIIFSIHDQEIRLWGSIKCSQKGRYFDPLWNSLK